MFRVVCWLNILMCVSLCCQRAVMNILIRPTYWLCMHQRGSWLYPQWSDYVRFREDNLLHFLYGLLHKNKQYFPSKETSPPLGHVHYTCHYVYGILAIRLYRLVEINHRTPNAAKHPTIHFRKQHRICENYTYHFFLQKLPFRFVKYFVSETVCCRTTEVYALRCIYIETHSNHLLDMILIKSNFLNMCLCTELLWEYWIVSGLD